MKTKIIRGIVVGIVIGALFVGLMRLGLDTLAAVICVPAYFFLTKVRWAADKPKPPEEQTSPSFFKSPLVQQLSIGLILLGFCILLVSLFIRSNNIKPAATPTAATAPATPTAAEIFDMRTKCAQLAEELGKRGVNGGSSFASQHSNYSSTSNRCYVEMIQVSESIGYTRVELRDGQTRKTLARMESFSSGEEFGFIKDGCSQETKIGDKDSCYEKAEKFIDQKMNEE